MNHQVVDDSYSNVTEQFKHDAAQLKSGQICNIEGFTLEDAISAFELGSVSMDTGLNFVTYEDSLKELGSPETNDEICTAMDSLFCREMAWLKGATLIQTVFSGIFVETQLRKINDSEMLQTAYIDQLDPTRQLLEVYVIATLKFCGLAVNEVTQALPVVSLDEEFHANSANWSLLENVPLDQVVFLLERAISHCQSCPELKEIGLRLQLRASVLSFFGDVVNNEFRSINQALQLITKIVPMESSTKWFGKGIQARSDGVCLPQRLITLDYVDAKAFFTTLMQNTKDSFTGLLSVKKSADLLGFYLNFAKEHHTPLLRSMVKNQINQESILRFPAFTWVQRDIAELSYPSLMQNRANITSKCKEEWDSFAFQAQMCYTDLLTCLCFGRCRQRQIMFEQVAAWDSLHVAAQALDKAIVRSGIGNTLSNQGKQSWAIEFSSWVYHRKLQLMLWSFLMGFEQELFSPYESAAMYWYAKNLAAILVEQLSRLKIYFQEHNYRQSPGYQYLVAMEVESRCLEHLCTANWLLYLVLEHRGLIKGPKFSQSTPELTFGLRVECFEAVGIPMNPSYQSFIKESEIYDDDLALNTIKQNVSGAQAFLKAISQVAGPNAEVQKLKRSAFGLSAIVLKLSKNSVEKIDFSVEGSHPYFPLAISI